MATRKGTRSHPGNQPTIVVLLEPRQIRAQRRIIQRAMELEWRVVDLWLYGEELPKDFRPDGAIIGRPWGETVPRKLLRMGCPTVRIGLLPHPLDKSHAAVIEDLAAVGRLAAEYFAERNFRHLGYVCHNPPGNFKLMNAAFESRGVELDCDCHHLTFRRLTPAEQVLPMDKKRQLRGADLSAWLRTVPKPIGMLGSNEKMAARICARSQEVGLDVPAQVAVLARGNEPLICESAPVPLSSIQCGADEEGEAAFEKLLALMEGRSSSSETVYIRPGEVITRKSTDALAMTDPVVGKAVRFMWGHLTDSMTVDDVAAAARVSRRVLERAFREQLDRGVNAEWVRRRLERTCELLKTTDLPIADIAPQVGLRSVAYLHTAFRRAYGTTPRQWRLKHQAADQQMTL